MLDHYLKDPELGSRLLPRDRINPFPPCRSRDFWESRPRSYRERILTRADEYRGREWSHIPPARYLDFFRNGDRGRFESYYNPRRTALGLLTLAECLDNRGEYVEDLVAAVWAICEESSWVLPAHISAGQDGGLPRRDTAFLDILAARTAGDLALCRHLLGDVLDDYDPAVSERIDAELERRIIAPYTTHDDFWWMKIRPSPDHATNNWNPWSNFGCLAACLLATDDAAKRLRAVRRYLQSVQVFLDYYHDDGGCDEGPSYWAHATGSLFEGLELLREATGGYIDVYDQPKIRTMARYIMHAHIAADYYVNYADCVPRLHPPAGVVHQLGRRIADDELAAFGRYLRQSGAPVYDQELSKALHLAAALPEIDAPAAPPLPADHYWQGVEIMIARERAHSTAGLFLAARGGSNGESHNHNDVGSIMLYLDGSPLIVDPGVESYRRETFSGDRYSIWTMQSHYHNLPAVDGHGQQPGPDARAANVAHTVHPEESALTCDIAPCYPAEARVDRLIRISSLERGEIPLVAIADEIALVRTGRRIEWSFMLPLAPGVHTESEATLTALSGARAELSVETDGVELEPGRVEEVPLNDRKMTPYWGAQLFRLVIAGTTTAKSARVRFRFARR